MVAETPRVMPKNLQFTQHSEEMVPIHPRARRESAITFEFPARPRSAEKPPGLLKNGNVFAEGKSRLVLIG
jgi:hypothetical protein